MIPLQLDQAELELKYCGFSKLKDKMWPSPVGADIYLMIINHENNCFCFLVLYKNIFVMEDDSCGDNEQPQGTVIG